METVAGADVGAIQKELKRLWREYTESHQNEGQQSVVRSCVLNLVAYAPGGRAENEVTGIMADISVQHPARMFLLLPKPESREPSINAWVNALCHVSGGGRKQVCCEQIVVRAEGDTLGQVPSIVRPLLIPDLPSVFWWRDAMRFDDRLFLDLLETCDRIIIDSAYFASPQQGMKELGRLMEKEKLAASFSDLNWARLGPWRLSIARLYDVPDYRPHLARIHKVEIEGGIAGSTTKGQSLLIAAWLASRLKWNLASRVTTSPTGFAMDLKAENRSIRIEANAGNGAGIQSVKFHADGARFEVTVAEGGAHLSTRSVADSLGSAEYVTNLDPGSEAHLIARELEILGHDRVYEQALSFLANLT